MGIMDNIRHFEESVIKEAIARERDSLDIRTMARIDNDGIRIPPASQLYRNHDEQRAKLFEILGLIEQLVLDKKGERILKLCRYLDNVVKDYHERGNLTQKPLIDLFRLLIDKDVKGERLLDLIDICFGGNAVKMINMARFDPKSFELILSDKEYSIENLKAKADKSFEDAMNVI